jgi:hypothetical protein
MGCTGLPGVLIVASAVGFFICNFGLLAVAVKLSGSHFSARARLRREGYKVCPECRYSLSELVDTGNCPECGFAYTPGILKERWEMHYEWVLEKPGR